MIFLLKKFPLLNTVSKTFANASILTEFRQFVKCLYHLKANIEVNSITNQNQKIGVRGLQNGYVSKFENSTNISTQYGVNEDTVKRVKTVRQNRISKVSGTLVAIKKILDL